jgi:hypothetical protein
LWRTLGALMLRPGRLTREYLVGRRRRYVLPLRLYLTASFLFFMVVKIISAGDVLQIEFAAGVDSQGRPIPVIQANQIAALRQKALRCSAAGHACTPLEQLEARLLRHLDLGPYGAQALQRRITDATPYAIFLMLPLFAALVQMAYRRSRIPYGAHFVFSLHLHTFWFAAMLVFALLPAVLQPVGLLATAMYGLWALRRVYGGRWGPTMLRAAVIGTTYLMALLAGSVVLVTGVLLAGPTIPP